MLTKDPAKRPSVRQILDKPFLKIRVNNLIAKTIAKHDISNPPLTKSIMNSEEKEGLDGAEKENNGGLAAMNKKYDSKEEQKSVLSAKKSNEIKKVQFDNKLLVNNDGKEAFGRS